MRVEGKKWKGGREAEGKKGRRETVKRKGHTERNLKA
jgi:hypothetical protein